MAEEGQHLDDWTPLTEEDRTAVLGQLEQMLESPLFRNSKRYPNLLRFLVEQTLAGNESLLRERLLGVTVFHRPPDYDTNQDTVVRLTASEVRKRIAQYYHQPEHAGQLQIDLRPGSYVPVFRPAEPAPLIRPLPGPEEAVDEPAAESSASEEVLPGAQEELASRNPGWPSCRRSEPPRPRRWQSFGDTDASWRQRWSCWPWPQHRCSGGTPTRLLMPPISSFGRPSFMSQDRCGW